MSDQRAAAHRAAKAVKAEFKARDYEAVIHKNGPVGFQVKPTVDPVVLVINSGIMVCNGKVRHHFPLDGIKEAVTGAIAEIKAVLDRRRRA